MLAFHYIQHFRRKRRRLEVAPKNGHLYFLVIGAFQSANVSNSYILHT